MSLTHVATFAIRYHDCDAYGHVNNTNYLRFMQEAAFAASAAAGYGAQRYREMGQLWLIRATDIEYLRPLSYGDSVSVTTWVQDFRRVTSRRCYELRSAVSGELAAKAVTDWIYVDAASGQPVRIPSALIAAFQVTGEAPPREKFPAAPEPPVGAFRVRRRMRFRDIDTVGHVNNAVYADYFEDCGTDCIAQYGWPVTRLQQAGLGIVFRRSWIEYLQPALYGDEIEFAAWLSDVKRVSALRHFSAVRVADGAQIARMTSLGVCANLAAGAPARWPAEMIADLGPNIAY